MGERHAYPLDSGGRFRASSVDAFALRRGGAEAVPPRDSRGHVGCTGSWRFHAAPGGALVPLRLVLSLFAVLVLAAPALAQQEKLTGTWRFRSVHGIAERGAVCSSGNV